MPAPESYLDARRPPLHEALRLEGGSFNEALKVLDSKGYFTPPPRPWSLGSNDRGHGHKSFGVLDKFGDLVVTTGDSATAQLIIDAVNSYRG